MDGRKTKRFRWIPPVLYTLVVIAAIVGLRFLGIPTMIIVITIVSALIIWFGFVAYRRFRSGRTTSGAVFTVLAIFLVLIDLKALQFQRMGAMAKMMGPPPTTVTSATVRRRLETGSVSSRRHFGRSRSHCFN